MSGSLGLSNEPGASSAGVFARGVGRCGFKYIMHAPSSLTFALRGLYQSVPQDGQAAKINWTMPLVNLDFPDGTGPGRCDTILSSNALTLENAEEVKWDLYDMSEPGNDIGHGVESDNLGMPQCNARIYSLIVRNWSSLEGSTGALELGNAGANEWNSVLGSGCIVSLPADSMFAIIGGPEDGLDVASDNCLLKAKASSGAVVWGLNYIACSA